VSEHLSQQWEPFDQGGLLVGISRASVRWGGGLGICPKCLLNATDKYLTEPFSIHSLDGLKVGKGGLIRKLEL